jgi:hypothetical protein
MADHRVERARIRLSDDIGMDPNARIDTAEFCWIDPSGIDANSCGARPLPEFYAADFPGWREDDKWFPSQEGLNTVRKLLNYYKRILEKNVDPLGRQMAVIEEKIGLLDEVENVLAAAEEAGAHFCIAVSD